ncbi:MAG: thioesterase family protein [Cellvibrionales bacterium]
MPRPEPSPRSCFQRFYELPTRWADNDIYGHANNVVYYAWFDTVVNRFLIEEGGMRPGEDPVVGYVVGSSCDYFSPVSYPEVLTLGLNLKRLGDKSVTWEIGVFAEGNELSSATGRFTHAFVDTHTGRSAAVPVGIRTALEATFA